MDAGLAKNPVQTFWKKIIKFVFFVLVFFLFFVLLALGILLLNENRIKSKAIEKINEYLNTPVSVRPENIQITFLRTFPNTTLRFREVLMMGSHPKHKDTLAYLRNIEFHFSIWKVLQNNIVIHKISGEGININAILRKDGKENWIFLKTQEKENKSSEGSARLDLESISLKNVLVHYIDFMHQNKIIVRFKDLNSAFTLSGSNMEIFLNANGMADNIENKNKSIIRRKSFSLTSELLKEKHNYALNKARFRLSDMSVSAKGHFVYDSTLKKASVQFSGDRLHPEDILSIVAYENQMLPQTNDPLHIEGNYVFDQNKHALSSRFEGRSLNIRHKAWNSTLTGVNLKGSFEWGSQKPENIRLSIETLEGIWNEKPFAAMLSYNSAELPELRMTYNGQIPVPLLLTLSGKDSLFSCKGELTASLTLECPAEQFNKKEIMSSTKIHLNLKPRGLLFEYKPIRKSIRVDSGEIFSDHQRVQIQNLSVKMGDNESLINGEWKKFMGYLFGNEPLEIQGRLYYKEWDIQSWLEEVLQWSMISSSGASTSSSSSGYRLNVGVTADVVKFGGFGAKNVFMELDWKDHQVFAEDIRMECMGGRISTAVRMDMVQNQYHFLSEGEFSDILMNEAFLSFNNFGQQTLTHKHLNGTVSGKYLFKGIWDENFNVLPGSILSQAEYTIRKGRLQNFEPLRGLSKFISIEELNDIRFDDLAGSVSVENQKILIPNTDIKNSALNITLKGEHTFQNTVDYHVTLLLSELLSKKSKRRDEFLPDEQNKRKAFIRIYGPMDKLQFSIDKQGIREKIAEDFKNQKSELKKIFQEEFKGKKDTASNNSKAKFELEDAPSQNKKPDKPPAWKKKKEEEEDDY